MKFVFYIAFAFLFISCNEKESEETKVEKENVVVEPEIVNSSLILPKGYILDTTLSVDTFINIKTSIILPKGINSEELSIFVDLEKVVESFTMEYLSQFDSANSEDSVRFRTSYQGEFSVEPVSIYLDSTIYSVLFKMYESFPGGAHGKGSFYTYNFDIVRGDNLTFSDFFSLPSEEDSMNMLYLINTASESGDFPVINAMYEMDFHVMKDSVSFNFDHYEICSYAGGMPQSSVGKKKLEMYIK